MSSEDQSGHKPIFHYEGNVPVFDPQGIDELAQEQENAKQRDKQYRDTQLAVNRWVMIFTGVLALCSILGGGISLRQAHIASRTIDEMQTTRAQAKIDNAAAIIAQQKIAQDSLTKSQENLAKSSQNAETTFRDEQRAWVGALAVTDVVIAEDKPPSFKVVLSNSGKTPALHLRFHVAEKFGIGSETIDFAYPPIAKGAIESDFVLQPGVQYFAQSGVATKSMTKLQVDAIAAGVMRVWIYGDLTYKDVSKRLHHTKFCFIESPDLKNGQPCNTFNEAD